MDTATPRAGTRAWLLLGGAAAALAFRAVAARARALDLRDRIVLITGGSRGLGLLLAREFAGHGATVAICGRDADALGRARDDLQRRGARALAVPCDVTRPEEVDALVGRVRRELGPLDVLVNNAGGITVGPLETMTREDFAEALQVNFWGGVHTTLAVLPEMRRRRAGRIVNVTSIGGKLAVPHLLPYSASKFAMVGFSEGLRAEVARDGVRVTTVVPGLMRTGSPRNATFKSRHRAEYAWFSISDALPLLSMDAGRAARRIVAACRRGDAEVVLSLPAQLAVTVHGLAPGTTADLLGLVNRWLPEPGGIGSGRATGRDSESAVAPSWLTALGDRAARRNNQLA
jgi:NAD(P)-dependent dehydrogenase (short-subunit alcohol dehydrogenase family)